MYNMRKILKRIHINGTKNSFLKYFSVSTYIKPSVKDGYSETPEYPPINAFPEESVEDKLWQENCDKIKRQSTVEEKLMVINVPRFWGWKSFMIYEGIIPFNNLTFAQHVTRTHIKKVETLPHYYDSTLKITSELAKEIKSIVLDSIEYQLHIRRKELSQELDDLQKEKELTKVIVSELNRVIISSIASKVNHIKLVQTDFSPRIEAFWIVNSLNETLVKKQPKYGIPLEELPEEYLERPSDKFIQYIGNPVLQLRHVHPLQRVIEMKKADIFTYSVPVFEYDPHIALGYEMNRRHVTNIPGFWPGDDRDFSFLSYHYLNHLKHRPSAFGEADTEQAILSQLIFASFGWLMSLASYQGFSVYNDVTYPLVTQTVTTNGQNLVCAVYQLNTTETHFKNAYENPRCNICWVTPEIPLFQEYVDGKIRGFNEKALQLLLQLYCKEPEPMKNINLKPYLGENVKYVAEYENDEKRIWLEKRYKHISANKPPARPDLMYEVQDWERIFKIQFRMRPRDARRRPFELRQNPYHMKMSDLPGEYIPKALRPDKHLPKWRQRKHARTFFPE